MPFREISGKKQAENSTVLFGRPCGRAAPGLHTGSLKSPPGFCRAAVFFAEEAKKN